MESFKKTQIYSQSSRLKPEVRGKLALFLQTLWSTCRSVITISQHAHSCTPKAQVKCVQTIVKCGKNSLRIVKHEVRNLPVIKMPCNVSYQDTPLTRQNSIQDFQVLCDYQKVLLCSKNCSYMQKAALPISICQETHLCHSYSHKKHHRSIKG